MVDQSSRHGRVLPCGPVTPGADDAADRWAMEDDVSDLLPYVSLFREWWKIIAAVVALAVLGTVLFTVFYEAKTYRATTIIKPVSPSDRQSQLGSGGGGLLAGGAGSMLGGLLPSASENDAEEYIAIMKSFSFTCALVKQHDLAASFTAKTSGLLGRYLAPQDPQWRLFRLLSHRLKCDYSPRSGLLTITFDDRDRARAALILGYYLHDLREGLRRRQVEDSASALASLKEEAKVTSDELLQTQLYQLIAYQIQREKLAQVQADFAFKVIEPPAVPDRPYLPKVAQDCLIAAVLALVLAYLAIVLYEAPRQLARRRDR